MKHLGDITKIHNPPVVDCITFGSPCQDLSIAGKRAGLAGERSGLFMEAVRIIKEMEEQSGGLGPTFAIWENVPGAFSSNKGNDFHAVLEELARIKEPEVSIPRPENGKWAKAGFICGNGWSIAWRTFDAQFWGVPQRRRRIALVLDLRGQRAGEILFERTGVSGDTEPSIPTWKGIARNPADGAAGHDRVVGGAGFNGYKSVTGSIQYHTETAATLEANMPGNVICLQGNIIDRDVQQNGSGIAESETMFTLNATDRHGVAIPIQEPGKRTGRSTVDSSFGIGIAHNGDAMYTLSAASQHGVCCAAFTAGQGAKANGIGWAEEQAPTLRTDGGLSAMPTVLCRAHGQANAETLEDCAPTLNCNHEQPIVFESHSQDARYTQQGNTSPACTAQWGTGGNNMPLVAEKALTPWDNQARRVYSEDGSFPALAAREHAGQNQQTVLHKTPLRWIVRRLTPTECERLQGFPDGWTDIGEWTDSKGKRHKPADSPRYKAMGNSIALPQWWWITCKMAQYLPEHATLGSLFDGIGGFPLVWETRHGEGTAIWASEIEEFPIAVTKERFPE